MLKVSLLGGLLFVAGCREESKLSRVDLHTQDAIGRTPLSAAAWSGNYDEIDELINAGSDIEAEDWAGDTPLVYAVKNGNLPAITRLLQEGADPRKKMASGASMVVHSLKNGNLAATHLLLRHGAGIRSVGKDGESLAHVAVQQGNIQFLKDLQTRGAYLEFEEGAGYGLLHVAYDLGHKEMLNYLLKLGLDTTRKNQVGDSVAHRAVRDRKMSLFPLLKKNGSDFNEPDAAGWRPLHLAIRAGEDDLVKALIRHGAVVNLKSVVEELSHDSLRLALDYHSLGIAKQLLDEDVEVGDELYKAVRLGGDRGLEIVNLLIEHDVSLETDREGDSPLNLAVREGEFEIVRSLLEAGAPQERLDLCGQKPFHLTMAKGDVAIAELLIKHGADVNEAFKKEPSEEFLRQVKTEGVGRWALKNSEGLNPLMLASDSGNLPMARLLIMNGANPGKSTRVSGHRFWPLTFAARQKNARMQQVLFKRTPGRTKRWIKVDLSDQKAVVHDGGKPIFTARISSGKKGHRTPTGEYVISNKYKEWESTLYHSKMPYFQRLSGGDFGFHYGSLPGYPASHGCIRVSMASAKKLFRLTRVGDYVEIVK